MKGEVKDWQGIFANHVWDGELIYKMYKEFLAHSNKNKNKQLN